MTKICIIAVVSVFVFSMIIPGNGVASNAYGQPTKAPKNLSLGPSSQEVPTGQPGNEVTMGAVNPLQPQNIVVVKYPTIAISNNFGQSFTTYSPTPPAGDGDCSDDVVAFDSQGRLFWEYIACNGGIIVEQNNPTTGAIIGNAVNIQFESTGSVPSATSSDKPWLAADANPASPFKDNLYAVWCEFDTGKLVFSRSLDQGQTWSIPSSMGVSDAGCNNQSHVAVAPNGDVYVSYSTNVCAETASITLLKDSAGGAHFAAGTFDQKTNPFPSETGTVSCNSFDGGTPIPNIAFWMVGSRIGYIVPDTVHPGTIYVFTSDDPDNDFSTGDAGDIVMAKSTDYGNTWTRSTVSHAPAGTLQVFPTATIDAQGNLAVMWWDDRSGNTETNPIAGNYLLDDYVSVSTDGGTTWTNDYRINQLQFNPDAGGGNRIGEYNGITAANGVGYVSFTGNTFSGSPQDPATNANGQQIYFSLFSILGQYPDRFEPNNAESAATDLGAHSTYSQSGLTINSVTDEDYYKITALDTGVIFTTITFNPQVAPLSLEIKDFFGDIVSTGSISSFSPGQKTLTANIHVIKNEIYYIHVFPTAPVQFAPQNVYSLAAQNIAAPVPNSLILQPSSDTGSSSSDGITKATNAIVQFKVDNIALFHMSPLSPTNDNHFYDDPEGYKLVVYTNGVLSGVATQTNPGTFTFNYGTDVLTGGAPLSEGDNQITAAVKIVSSVNLCATCHANGDGAQSQSLLVRLDTTPPLAPSTPDLLAASDTGGINDDDITTITTPQFGGTGEASTHLRIYSDGVLSGQTDVNTSGQYQVTIIPQGDGVHQITATLEDAAGNISPPSSALKLTVANQGLTLPGGTATAPTSAVTIDLGANTIAGYLGVPGISGNVGIANIPNLTLDIGGQALNVLGTTGVDSLQYKPTGPNSGVLTRAGSTQVITFTNVGGVFTVDPAAGVDTLTVLGSATANTIKVDAQSSTTVTVDALLPMKTPIANVELLSISSGDGPDTVNVITYTNVNAKISVDGGQPSTSPPKPSDALTVHDASGGAKIQIKPGKVGSGSITVTYPLSQVRVDFVNVENVHKA